MESEEKNIVAIDSETHRAPCAIRPLIKQKIKA